MKRKEFIKLVSASFVMTSIGVTISGCGDDDNLLGELAEPIEIDLSASPFDVLQTQGGWLLHPDDNILLINNEGTIRAFTSVCTHTGCARNWSFDDSEFICTCHNSKFNTSGNVVSGPASGSLAQFTVSRTGDLLTLS